MLKFSLPLWKPLHLPDPPQDLVTKLTFKRGNGAAAKGLKQGHFVAIL